MSAATDSSEMASASSTAPKHESQSSSAAAPSLPLPDPLGFDGTLSPNARKFLQDLTRELAEHSFGSEWAVALVDYGLDSVCIFTLFSVWHMKQVTC